ncbi:MAG: hypothetical protein IPJ68_00590 [Candidatus Moraniibacteriota bacterium]|nr:MAG: hypothetical protein IPJ68_00590 [Candidatus Moranbacteria bacterium]
MATTLTPYARAMAEQATADVGRINRRIRSAGLRFCFIVVSVIMVGVLLKFFHLTPLLWTLMLVVIVYTGASLLGYTLALTPPVWIYNLFRGTLGEENEIPEGLAAAKQATKKLWRIWLWAMSYSAVALEVIALWNIEDNIFLVVPILAVGLLVILLSVVLFQESVLFPWLMFWINCALLITMLGMALPGNAGITVTRWVDQARTATKAHKAEDDAKRAVEEAINAERATCFANIKEKAKGNPAKKVAPVLPTQADFAQCEKIGFEETSGFHWSLPASKPDADTAQQQSGAASKPAPAVATTPTETAVTQTAWSCDTTVKVVDYTPSNQPGEVDIGSLPAGRYEVTATGKRRQMFFAGTAMDPVPTQLCEMDSYGRIGFCWNPDGQKVVRNMNGQPWFAPPNVPGSEPLLITEEPGEARVPYGALVIQAMGARLPIAPANQRTRLKFDQPFAVALNVNRYQGVRNHEGDGTLRVEIRQCHTT